MALDVRYSDRSSWIGTESEDKNGRDGRDWRTRVFKLEKEHDICNEPIETLHKQAVAEPIDKYVHADPVQSFPLIASDRTAAND